MLILGEAVAKREEFRKSEAAISNIEHLEVLTTTDNTNNIMKKHNIKYKVAIKNSWCDSYCVALPQDKEKAKYVTLYYADKHVAFEKIYNRYFLKSDKKAFLSKMDELAMLDVQLSFVHNNPRKWKSRLSRYIRLKRDNKTEKFYPTDPEMIEYYRNYFYSLAANSPAISFSKVFTPKYTTCEKTRIYCAIFSEYTVSKLPDLLLNEYRVFGNIDENKWKTYSWSQKRQATEEYIRMFMLTQYILPCLNSNMYSVKLKDFDDEDTLTYYFQEAAMNLSTYRINPKMAEFIKLNYFHLSQTFYHDDFFEALVKILAV